MYRSEHNRGAAMWWRENSPRLRENVSRGEREGEGRGNARTGEGKEEGGRGGGEGGKDGSISPENDCRNRDGEFNYLLIGENTHRFRNFALLRREAIFCLCLYLTSRYQYL